MKIKRILAQLIAERDKVDQQIEAWQTTLEQGKRPGRVQAGERKAGERNTPPTSTTEKANGR